MRVLKLEGMLEVIWPNALILQRRKLEVHRPWGDWTNGSQAACPKSYMFFLLVFEP